ncbi:LOB domain-containing protein 30-like [Impatiens glandulifera]|uniref:LOB domain-containing protein 30-like n=1 Tax=Impatiens glandulifera TaxID=253017 RepID=UPI001FB18B83|nr:LOB domain-containing protein 30-like [Impatiens glandulifera]
MSIKANSHTRIRACGACKFLRKKCLEDCIFAPYFNSGEGTVNFAAVHKIFGASNVTNILTNVPIHKRPDTVFTLNYEAHARLRDPIYGCMSEIRDLQNQVINLQSEISCFQVHVARQPPPQQQPPFSLSMSDFPFADAGTYDMSVPLYEFDPNNGSSHQQANSWAANLQQFNDNTFAGAPVGGVGEEFARELLLRFLHNLRDGIKYGFRVKTITRVMEEFLVSWVGEGSGMRK